MGDCGVYPPCGVELGGPIAVESAVALRLRRPTKKKTAPMIATAARTPITMPAIAPPDSEELEVDLPAPAAAVAVLVVEDAVVAVLVVVDAVDGVLVEGVSVEDVVVDKVVGVSVGEGVADEDGTKLSLIATP